jgi:hypothetical protein
MNAVNKWVNELKRKVSECKRLITKWKNTQHSSHKRNINQNIETPRPPSRNVYLLWGKKQQQMPVRMQLKRETYTLFIGMYTSATSIDVRMEVHQKDKYKPNFLPFYIILITYLNKYKSIYKNNTEHSQNHVNFALLIIIKL